MTYLLGVILKKKNKKIVAIIQARMGSKRFPGKMLEKLNGYPILEWVIVRLKKSKYISQIIVATSSLAQDDQIEKISKDNDVRSLRSDENEVHFSNKTPIINISFFYQKFINCQTF